MSPNLNETSLLAYIAKSGTLQHQRGGGRRLVAHETLLGRIQELFAGREDGHEWTLPVCGEYEIPETPSLRD